MNKCLLLILMFASFNLSSVEIPQNESKIVQTIGKIIQATHQPEAYEIWPGFDLTVSPIAISFSNGHVMAFNHSNQNSLWENKSLGKYEFLFSPKDHWKVSSVPFQANFLMDGTKAFVFNMDPVLKGDLNSFHIFVHERFHSYQFEFFKAARDSGHYMDQMNVENLTLIQMEESALAEFLKAESSAKKEYLIDFVALNATRRLMINSSSVLWEDLQQKMEGLAEYVSFKLFDIFPILKGKKGTEQLHGILKQYSASPEIAERVIRWRHYGVGASMGYALDYLQVKDWKSLIEKEGLSLFEILDSNLAMTPEETYERLNDALIYYHYTQVKNSVFTSVKDFQDNLQKLSRSYENVAGVEVSITSPEGSAISGQGTTKKQLSLPNGANVSIEDSSILSSSDQSWRLELKQPYVFQTPAGAREFKCDYNAELEVDGRKTTVRNIVNEKRNQNFKSIAIKGKGTNFISKGNKGRLVVERGKLLIRFK